MERGSRKVREIKERNSKDQIIVLGDYMVDRYWYGTVRRHSQEAPIPIVDIALPPVNLPGGADNVALNISGMGGRAVAPTIRHRPLKNRLIADGRQVARWDQEDYCELEPFDKIPDNITKIIIADYAKGAITPKIVKLARDSGLPTFVDTKQDPTDYVGWVEAIFPNRDEHNQFRSIYDMFETCVVTCGADGAVVNSFGKRVRQVPAYNDWPISVCGAGDTFTAAYALRWPHKGALEFASLAAAVAVGKPDTSVVTLEEIYVFKRKLRGMAKKP